MESHRRSILKALSWRCIAVIITAIVAGSITHKVSVGLAIGIADSLIKIGVYYIHERLWYKLGYGYIRHDTIE